MSAFPLGEHFLRHAAVPLEWPAGPDLEQVLRQAFARGQEAFPGLPLSAEDFVEHLACVLAPADAAGTPAAYAEGLRGDDLYLAAACDLAVPGAADLLERLVQEVVPAAVASLRQSAAFADEVRQATLEKLLLGGEQALPGVRQYRGRGSLRSLIRVSAARLALNLLQRHGREVPADQPAALEHAMEPDLDPEMTMLKGRFSALFSQALRDATAALAPEQLTLMDLYYRRGLKLEEIGRLQGVNYTTVLRRLGRARAAIFTQTKRLLKERLGLDSTEFRDMLALVYSQIDVSMSGMFRREAP